MITDYEDLELELGKCCCGKPEIRILRSTFDRPRARFELDDEKRRVLEEKIKDFDQLLLLEDGSSQRRQLAEEIGSELYNILLPGEIGRTVELSYNALRGGDGLRLRLSFGENYDHSLGGLPWELICYPETGQFVGHDERTPVARYLDLSRRIRPLEVEPPLKVLAVIASPDPSKASSRYLDIDKDRHRKHLKDAIGKSKYLQVRFLHEREPSGRSTLDGMRKELRKAEQIGSPYHAVHFLCHGGFNEDGEGALLLERKDGHEHFVTGKELAGQLTGDVKLVVLASCRTGEIPIPRHGGQNPFSGVASSLVAKGLPAVVAMQFTVSEDALVAFSDAFYGAVDENRHIDDAVTEGRLRIGASGDEGAMEWATPVLFLRAFDGNVLDLKTDSVPPKTVSVFNTLDYGREKMEGADFQVDLQRYFDGRYLKEDEDWNGSLMDDLRHSLHVQIPGESPSHFELAAPLSIAFATGFLLPAKVRKGISVGQRDQVWDLDRVASGFLPGWLSQDRALSLVPDNFPLVEEGGDIAVVVETTRPALPAVAKYLNGVVLNPPKISTLILARFDSYDHFSVKDGPHARTLAMDLMATIDAVATEQDQPTVHFFLSGPHGLALAIGRQAQVLRQVQLYEFDFEKQRHKTYEPSITLVPSMSKNS